MSILKQNITAVLVMAAMAPAFPLSLKNYDFRQQQSFQPLHRKKQRGKFKRSGKS